MSLNHAGFSTAKGVPWSASMSSNKRRTSIILRKVNLGCILYQKDVVAGKTGLYYDDIISKAALRQFNPLYDSGLNFACNGMIHSRATR